VRRGLAPVLENAQIIRVEQRRENLRFPFPDRFAERLEGQRVTDVARRAKFLLVHLEDGLVLIGHLGMSGSFRIEEGGDDFSPDAFTHERSKSAAHDHVVFYLSRQDGRPARVIYNDPRRFGFMLFADGAAINEHPSLSGLGVEPTGNSLDGEVLSTLFAGKKTPLKAALLDQRLIAGLGNIYVCEALWRAGLSPKRAAGTIATAKGKATVRSTRLAENVRAVIAEAIAAGGSSLRDHVQTDGSLGYFQHSFSVYDREGEPCPRKECRGTIMRIVQSGRSTYYCPSCQR